MPFHLQNGTAARRKYHLHNENRHFRLKTRFYGWIIRRFVWISERKRKKSWRGCCRPLSSRDIYLRLSSPWMDPGKLCEKQSKAPNRIGNRNHQNWGLHLRHLKLVVQTNKREEWRGLWMHFMTWRPSSQGRGRFYIFRAIWDSHLDREIPNSVISNLSTNFFRLRFFSPPFPSSDTHVDRRP